MKKSSGFTLIEFVLIAGLAMVVLLAGIQRMMSDMENQKAAIAGEQIASVGDAVGRYINANLAGLAGAPYTNITIATLTGANILPATFSPTNAMGGAYTIRIKRVSAAPPRFEALVTVPAITDSNGNARLDLAGVAVIKIGANGGMTYDATAMSGSTVGWTALPADYPAITASAQLGYFISAVGSPDSTYLRTDGGNMMLGALNMAGQSINAANTITATGNLGATGGIQSNANISAAGNLSATNATITGALQTGTLAMVWTPGIVVNTPCAANGSLTVDATGAALSCVSNLWKKSGSDFWQDPVATFAALPAGTIRGEVRVVTDISRAFIWNGAAWAAIAVDQNGNLTVPGTVTMADATVTSLTGYSTQTLSNLMPRNSWQATYAVRDGDAVPKPTCGAGGTPLIFMIPQILDASDGVYTFRATSVGASWVAEIRTGAGIAQPQGRALAVASCSY